MSSTTRQTTSNELCSANVIASKRSAMCKSLMEFHEHYLRYPIGLSRDVFDFELELLRHKIDEYLDAIKTRP